MCSAWLAPRATRAKNRFARRRGRGSRAAGRRRRESGSAAPWMFAVPGEDARQSDATWACSALRERGVVGVAEPDQASRRSCRAGPARAATQRRDRQGRPPASRAIASTHRRRRAFVIAVVEQECPPRRAISLPGVGGLVRPCHRRRRQSHEHGARGRHVLVPPQRPVVGHRFAPGREHERGVSPAGVPKRLLPPVHIRNDGERPDPSRMRVRVPSRGRSWVEMAGAIASHATPPGSPSRGVVSCNVRMAEWRNPRQRHTSGKWTVPAITDIRRETPAVALPVTDSLLRNRLGNESLTNLTDAGCVQHLGEWQI